MMPTYTLHPSYILRDDGACIPLDECNRDYQEYLVWIAEGNVPDSPLPTFSDYCVEFMAKFSAWVEDVAHANEYDSSVSCASYANSTVQQFANDAAAFIAWRDALWVWAGSWKAGFGGVLPATIPTWEQVKAEAPQPEAYGWVVH